MVLDYIIARCRSDTYGLSGRCEPSPARRGDMDTKYTIFYVEFSRPAQLKPVVFVEI